MLLDTRRVRQYLQQFDFKNLFIEELGWNHYADRLEVNIDGQVYILTGIAEQGGMAVFRCPPDAGGRIPKYPVRRKIERQVTRTFYEHLIVYVDGAQASQVWQWVKREPGRPGACREHSYYYQQSGDSLIQKLNHIAFTFEDLAQEEGVHVLEVTGRVRAAFDVDRLTKRFYERFKKEHEHFLRFLEGIPDEELQRWYVSVMLNRLMFIYFIQKKGFLDGNTDYLRTKLHQTQEQGENFFYREFLCPLFFAGFAKKETERSAEINDLLGRVPYLNGGLFLKHEIEERYPRIQIPDSAFERIFDFFDQYQWHLDERPLRADNEINPDVLGYIFEKYINQKQMGAYYTKEDITGYISKNTIISFLFDVVFKRHPAAASGECPLWRLLQEDPDRYIYPSVRKGAELPLPAEIADGLNDVSGRTEWNKPALPEYALPTEIWREVVTRRKRYEEIKALLTEGKITAINDLITYNLNIRQFAQDVVENIEDPDLLRTFYHTIAGKIPEKSNEKFAPGISILDPTCGSGAFLFAALNILEPLYEACLDRMQSFVDDLERSGEKHGPQKFVDFRNVLKQVSQHPNRRYFVLKSIIMNNLYGVDIMEEAAEICKLRLFLKLIAQVDRVEDIEPLPDIDFNIRTGNTLVGFASYAEVKKAVTYETNGQMKMEFDNPMARLEEKARDVDRLFNRFRQMQTGQGMEAKDFTEAKQELRKRLSALNDELDRYLAGWYGIDQNHFPKAKEYEQKFQSWRQGHKPFHWFVEFYGILKNGGFDVIIGNPPYVEYNKVKPSYLIKNYQTEACGNLYAFVMERNNVLLTRHGRTGMIVPHSAFCTDRMEQVINLFSNGAGSWISTYSIRPAKLFIGADQRLAIYLISFNSRGSYTTCYHHWHEEFRPHLLESIKYAKSNFFTYKNSLPKAGTSLEAKVWDKLLKHEILGIKLSGGVVVYYHNAPRYWIRAMTFAPYFWNERHGEQISAHVKPIFLSTNADASAVASALNSSLFYWWFVLLSDCRDLNMREIKRFPLGLGQMKIEHKEALNNLCDLLMANYLQHAVRKECQYKTTGTVIYDEFYPRYSKPIIDEIDRVLARHYGFTDEELDFIVNYDIKYRMGLGAGEGKEE